MDGALRNRPASKDRSHSARSRNPPSQPYLRSCRKGWGQDCERSSRRQCGRDSGRRGAALAQRILPPLCHVLIKHFHPLSPYDYEGVWGFRPSHFPGTMNVDSCIHEPAESQLASARLLAAPALLPAASPGSATFAGSSQPFWKRLAFDPPCGKFLRDEVRSISGHGCQQIKPPARI